MTGNAGENHAHQLLVSALSWTAVPAFVKIASQSYAGTESLLLASAPAGADWKLPKEGDSASALSAWVLSRLPGGSVVLVTLLLHIIINSPGR